MLPTSNASRTTVVHVVPGSRSLDLLAADKDDLETVAHMTDFEAIKVADLLCKFEYDLG